MKQKKASVVVPMHNAAQYIEETVNSLLEQTYRPLEVLIVDDGSTDASADIVRAMDDRGVLRVISQAASGGPSSPRNRGLREASGDVIFLFDADDIAVPQKVERTMTAFSAAPDDVLLAISDFGVLNQLNDAESEESFFDRFDSLMSVLSNDEKNGVHVLDPGLAYDRLLFGNFVGTSSVAIRSSALDVVGFFDEQLRYSEDYEYWIRLMRAGGVAIVNEVLHFYRNHEEGLSKRSERFLAPYKIQVLQNQLKNALTKTQRDRVMKKIAEEYVAMGWEAKQSKDYDEAIRYYRNAMQASAQLSVLKSMFVAYALSRLMPRTSRKTQ